MTALHHVEPGEWRRSIERALAPASASAEPGRAPNDGGLSWRALIVSPHGVRVIWTEAPGGAVESIVELVEAAGWDEREAHDLYGLEFDGHEPIRALVTHPETRPPG